MHLPSWLWNYESRTVVPNPAVAPPEAAQPSLDGVEEAAPVAVEPPEHIVAVHTHLQAIEDEAVRLLGETRAYRIRDLVAKLHGML